jgi:hypothetical protein
MNPTYVVVVKQDLDKLITTGFITLVEESTWLSPIVVLPKKNEKFQRYMDFQNLNVTIKKNPIPLLFTKRVLDMVAGHEIYFFWMEF